MNMLALYNKPEIRRKKQRLYVQTDKSVHYKKVQKLFNEKKKSSIKKEKEKLLNKVKEGSLSNAYKALRSLGTEDNSDGDFPLPVLDDDNLSPKECANKIAIVIFVRHIKSKNKKGGLWIRI